MRTRLFIFNFNGCFKLAILVGLAVFYVALGRLYENAAGQNKINTYNRQRFDEFYDSYDNYDSHDNYDNYGSYNSYDNYDSYDNCASYDLRANPENTLDWVFLGSSHAYCTFDPANFAALGIAAYQMGMPLQLLDSSYYTLLEVLSYQNPSTVVLDLYWYLLEQDFDAKQMETFFQVFRNDALKAAYLHEVLPLEEKVKYHMKPIRYQSDFFAYVNSKLLNVLDYRFGLKKTAVHTPGEEYYKGRGYVYYDYVMSEEQYRETATQPVYDMGDWQMAASQQYYLDKIVALCRERDIRLVLVTAPVSNVEFSRIKNYAAFHDTIMDYATNHHLAYLDFNRVNETARLFDDACFMDPRHLNDRGVKIANAYFAEWMGY